MNNNRLEPTSKYRFAGDRGASANSLATLSSPVFGYRKNQYVEAHNLVCGKAINTSAPNSKEK